MSEQDPSTERMARALGWVSLGLGASMTFAPRTVTKISGVDDSMIARTMCRVVGVREFLHAAALLAGRPEWVWTRVAGDAMDLPALLIALKNRHGTRRARAAMATAAVAGITAADVYTAMCTLKESGGRAGRDVARADMRGKKNGATHVEAAVTVNRSREDAYQYWHDFTKLPEFMLHLESVRMHGDGQLHWRAEDPIRHKTIEWDATIVEDRPNELISWRAADGGEGPSMGTVRFVTAPGGRGTEVRMQMDYQKIPAGKVGIAMAKLAGEAPDQQANDDLRRFKQIMEVGEIVRSEGSPEGTHTHRLLRQRPAQPMP